MILCIGMEKIMIEKYIEIRNLGKSYLRQDGNRLVICKNLNLTIERGKIYSIVGNSGCGKSTLINIIGGFEEYQEGKIMYFANKKERIGIVFQDNVLYPWKTVMENMLLACEEIYQYPKNIIEEQLKKIGLSQTIDCYPNELSGGMQQRIALLRVLLTKPDFVILDEAFGSLDYKTRMQMHEFFMDYHKKYKFTAIIVTHDILEACKLGNKIWILKDRPLVCKEINIQGGEYISQIY